MENKFAASRRPKRKKKFNPSQKYIDKAIKEFKKAGGVIEIVKTPDWNNEFSTYLNKNTQG